MIFRGQDLSSYMVNFDNQFKSYQKKELEDIISKIVPDMVIFDRLVETVVYLCNQIKCIDSSIVLLGRRGTGKRFLLHICQSLLNINFVTTIS